MSNIDIIRAWKDEEYRRSLSEEERAQLPENPAGLVEDLTDTEMEAVAGGFQIEIPNLSWVDACPSALACPWTIFNQTIFEGFTVFKPTPDPWKK
jgi:mersacidin/lichenicidin family type 2 lantibiotic